MALLAERRKIELAGRRMASYSEASLTAHGSSLRHPREGREVAVFIPHAAPTDAGSHPALVQRHTRPGPSDTVMQDVPLGHAALGLVSHRISQLLNAGPRAPAMP